MCVPDMQGCNPRGFRKHLIGIAFPLRARPFPRAGNADAGRMLSSLSRLCTHYLQSHGFSCGIDDMLLVPNAEANRKALLATANDATHRSAEEFAYAGVAPVADRLRPSATVREQLESRLRERAGCEAAVESLRLDMPAPLLLRHR